jgi:hypothetical protein
MPSTSASSTAACAGCGDTSTSEADWDQCGRCLEWCREDCSSLEGGRSFLCGRCSIGEWAILFSTLCTLVRPDVQECVFCKFSRSTTATSTCVHCRFLCLTFVANRWIKLGVYFELIYCLTFTELRRKTVKCAILLTPSLTHSDTQSDGRYLWTSPFRWYWPLSGGGKS